MQWENLQTEVVQMYCHAKAQLAMPPAMTARIGNLMLASIPESQLSHEDAMVRLASSHDVRSKTSAFDRVEKGVEGLEDSSSSYYLLSFQAWAINALHDELSKHGGCMHWQDVQKSLAQRYLSETEAAKQWPLSYQTHIEDRVLAVIPVSHLSHDDEMIRFIGKQQTMLVEGDSAAESESTTASSRSIRLRKSMRLSSGRRHLRKVQRSNRLKRPRRHLRAMLARHRGSTDAVNACTLKDLAIELPTQERHAVSVQDIELPQKDCDSTANSWREALDASSLPSRSSNPPLACLPKLQCGKLQYVSTDVQSLPRMQHGKWQVSSRMINPAFDINHRVARQCIYGGA
jgi:hypothetical protein